LLEEDVQQLNEVVVTAQQDAVTGTMDKKTYSVDDNVSQSGGSVLQAMNNLPGVTTQDGQVQLRGNNQVVVLIDGKQTAITGFGNQNGLDNIPASAIEKIEIINNPSAKYDANGNAGTINIVLKKKSKKDLTEKWVCQRVLVGCGYGKRTYLAYGHSIRQHPRLTLHSR
jgi:outer membrane receptor protein involved in Fe transport